MIEFDLPGEADTLLGRVDGKHIERTRQEKSYFQRTSGIVYSERMKIKGKG